MEEQLKQTCLHDLHVGSGAKMSPFAGYDMPIQYSGIIDEHNAVRHDVGMFDVSHMGEIFISGEDAEKFVNHIFTNDVAGMEPGKILYGMMCYDDGGTVDDLLVYREYAPQSWLLVVNASNIDKDYAWLKMQACRWKVEVDNQSDKWGQIAVQGPNAEKAVVDVLGFAGASSLKFYEFRDEKAGDGSRVILSRTGYTGEDGFEIYAAPAQIRKYWEALLAAGVRPCGLGCRDTLRFEAGLPLYGDELSAEISPVMAGLSMFCKLDKGYPVELEDGSEVGRVTTGYHSISLGKSLCFALVDSSYAALGTPLFVRIRKRVFPGTVVKKRFYQTNYKK